MGTKATPVHCSSCHKRVPGRSRCPRCLGVIEAVVQGLDAEPVAVLGHPDQGHEGSWLWHVRRDRTRRAEALLHPTDAQVLSLVYFARHGKDGAAHLRADLQAVARQRATDTSHPSNVNTRSTS